MIDKEIIQETIPFDKGYFKTFIDLYRRPERVINDLESYSKPFKYSTITVAVPVFVAWVVNNYGLADWTDWAMPKRIIEIVDSYEDFRENFDSILYFITTLPIIFVLTNLLFRQGRKRSFRIALFLTAQLLFTLIILSQIPTIIAKYDEVNWSLWFSIILLIGLAYFMYFSLRVFGRNYKIFIKALVLMLIGYILHFQIREPFVRFIYHRIRNGERILYSVKANQNPIYGRDVNNLKYLNFSTIDQLNNTIEVIGETSDSKDIYQKLTLGGELVSEKNLDIDAIYFLKLKGEIFFLGYNDYNDTSRNLIVQGNHISWKLKVGKRMNITDASTFGDQYILICGFNKIKELNYPRLIILRALENSDFQIQRDTTFDIRDNKFTSVIANDSSIYLVNLIAPKNETSLVTIKSIDFLTLNTNWETSIFTKTTKYSPYHNIKILKDPKESTIYGIYKIPNDTNTSIIINRLQTKSGLKDYSKRERINADDISFNSVTLTDKDLILCGAVTNILSENPFIDEYTLGGIFTFTKSNGELNRTRLYGNRLFESYNSFLSVSVTQDTTYVVNFNTFHFLYGAYRQRKFEILKFVN